MGTPLLVSAPTERDRTGLNRDVAPQTVCMWTGSDDGTSRICLLHILARAEMSAWWSVRAKVPSNEGWDWGRSCQAGQSIH